MIMDIGAGAYPPLSGITDDNHAGVIIVFVVASVLFSICFALIRFLLSARKRLGFWYDDLFISLCLVCTVNHGVNPLASSCANVPRPSQSYMPC